MLTLVVYSLTSRSGFCQDANFGQVLINTQPAEQVVTITNPYSDPANYNVGAPGMPFTLDQGGSGTLGPNQSALVSFGFQPQSKIDPYGNGGYGSLPQESFSSQAGVTISDNVKSAYTSYNISLEAILCGPQPTNVVKVASTPTDEIELLPANAVLADLIGGQYLYTTLSFKSTTGNVLPLRLNMIIREVLFIQPSQSVHLTPYIHTYANFPNACDSTNLPVYQLNPPWQPGYYPVAEPQPFYPSNGKVGSDPAYTVMDLIDGHSTLTFVPQFQSGSVAILQIYQWTAPWLITTCDDGSPKTNWFNLLEDVILRNVSFDPYAQGWEESIDITAILDATTDTPTPQPDIQGTFYLSDLTVVSSGASASNGGAVTRIGWLVPGSTLQTAPKVQGPWTDIPSTTNVVEFDITNSSTLPSSFFKLRLPPAD